MRVLCVTGSAPDAEVIGGALGRLDGQFDLTIAGDLAQARSQLEGCPGFELALIASGLPEGSTGDVVEAVRARSPATVAFILASRDDPSAALEALRRGADDYLFWDRDHPELLSDALCSNLPSLAGVAGLPSQSLRILFAGWEVPAALRELPATASGLDLTAVATGAEAVARLTASGEAASQWDAVLLDLNLPGLEALDAIKEMRWEDSSAVPVILLGDETEAELVRRAPAWGFHAGLFKGPGLARELPAVLEGLSGPGKSPAEPVNGDEVPDNLAELLAATSVILYTLDLRQGSPIPTWISQNVERLLGFTRREALEPGWWQAQLHPQDQLPMRETWKRLFEEGEVTAEYRFYRKDGRYVWIRDEMRLLSDASGHPCEIVGSWEDITEPKESELTQEVRNAALDQVLSNRPLSEILEDVAQRLEAIQPEMAVSILLLDQRTGLLTNGAGPSLPDYYKADMEGLPPGEGIGSCGEAAFRGEPVIVEDIRTHPNAAPYREIAEQAGLRSTWSYPLKDHPGRVLGTFAIYHGEPRSPTENELELVGEFARIIGLAVERGRAADRLRQAAAVFESIRDGVFITDPDFRILAVNRAFCEIKGSDQEEVQWEVPWILDPDYRDEELFEKIREGLEAQDQWQGEAWDRRQEGELFPTWLTVSVVRNDTGEVERYVGVFTDVSDLKQYEAKLEYLAHYDPLTGQPNRVLMRSQLSQALERAKRRGQYVGVLYLDLDRFKTVNDSLGHPMGDELLVTVANRLEDRLRGEDVLVRMGGDEFVIILDDLPKAENSAIVAQSLIETLALPIQLSNGHEVTVGGTIGISLYPDNGDTPTELIQHADAAMYQAKELGGNTYHFHTEDLTRGAQRRLDLETRLSQALERDELRLLYQPIFSGPEGDQLVGTEALLRWEPPGEEPKEPSEFLEVAEETGLIVPLGEWALRTACGQARAWLDAGYSLPLMAVNLSPRQFRTGDIADRVPQVLEETGLPAEYLELEVPEGYLMEQGSQALATLNSLQELGLRLAIDDFGIGFSSLAHFKRFPIHRLKIEKGIIQGLPEDTSDPEIASAIIAFGHHLQLKVSAKGVASREALELLVELGCDTFQGFLLSDPLPAEKVFPFLSGSPAGMDRD